MTPLHFAAAHGHLEAANVLLEAGADINAQEKSGFSVIERAIWCAPAELVAKLLASGAQIANLSVDVKLNLVVIDHCGFSCADEKTLQLLQKWKKQQKSQSRKTNCR